MPVMRAVQRDFHAAFTKPGRSARPGDGHGDRAVDAVAKGRMRIARAPEGVGGGQP